MHEVHKENPNRTVILIPNPVGGGVAERSRTPINAIGNPVLRRSALLGIFEKFERV